MRSFIIYALHQLSRVTKSRRIWAGHVARKGEMRSAYKTLVEEPEGKRPLGRQRR
jgi:hypothetical protein